MHSRRDATRTIWKTVVFAGAMLGGAACAKKHAAPTTPTPTTTEPAPATGGDGTATAPDPCASTDQADPCSYDPCADPCAGRPRGVSEEGDVGRGFVLS